MFDCHYDLLTYIYMNKQNLNPVISHCNKIFNNNITGGIFNLFYMTKEEMKEELNINENEIDIINNLKTVNYLIRKYKIISYNIKYIIGIEGLDYLKNIDDIDVLYNMGVRSVNIVWNNQNKYGAGAKISNQYGLTTLGGELIEKLVEKKIAIDLSHTNEKTFYDIINKCKILKQKGLKPIVFASHSNTRMYCNVSRNLTNRQLVEIKKLDGIIGIVSIKKFCSTYKNIDYEKAYINHIKYLIRLFGGTANIAIATDDMTYYNVQSEIYQNMNVFRQEEAKWKIEKLLINSGYNEENIKQILTENVNEKILKKL